MIFFDKSTGEILENVGLIGDDSPKTQPKPRGRMIEITCAAPGCSNKKMVKLADVKRGWGKFCSKACAKK